MNISIKWIKKRFTYRRFLINVPNFEGLLFIFRRSHRSCSLRKGVLRNFAKFTGKHLRQSLFFNKAARHATLLKKRLWHRCFPVNFGKLPRTTFLQKTSGRVLLYFRLTINACHEDIHLSHMRVQTFLYSQWQCFLFEGSSFLVIVFRALCWLKLKQIIQLTWAWSQATVT